MSRSSEVDYLIIGGGFYGCCLALFLRSISDRIMLVEAGSELLSRASRVNQARIHTGFHYPRSVLTAVKSMALHQRFATDFPDAVVSDFQMLYAIAQRRSKISAKRFLRMFQDMGAPIAPATTSQAALFDHDTIEAAFACREYAFDYSVLRRHMINRFDALDLDVRLQTEVTGVTEQTDDAIVRLSTGEEIRAKQVFNVTYAQLNRILRSAGLPETAVKHELAEIALVKVPPELENYGITVMDGPFFSCMPYPSEKLHSLTHVRYTPHYSWIDEPGRASAYDIFGRISPETKNYHMIVDSKRYVPAMAEAQWQHSIYDVKTVLLKNEKDDGRPILFRQQPPDSKIISVMGGKLDNVYDLFNLIRQTRPEWAGADERFVHPAGQARGGSAA
jgi:glycine/D-amino acid oxidase-like deaminating enzyme